MEFIDLREGKCELAVVNDGRGGRSGNVMGILMMFPK
jgi:hypothetical protein